MTENEIAATLEGLPAAVNADAGLVRRGRHCSTTLAVFSGSTPVYLTVSEGRLTDARRGPAIMRSWRFAIRADADAWTRFWQSIPEPGFHDLLAMARFGRATIEGDLHPFLAHLRYFKELLALPREIGRAR